MIMYFPHTKKDLCIAQAGFDCYIYHIRTALPSYSFGISLPEYRFDRDWFNRHKDVEQVLTWIYENIVMKLKDLTYITLNVLIRISTGLLNKCNLDKDLKIQLHLQLVKKIQEEFCYEMNKDLPFQLQIIGLVYSSYCGQTISTMRVTR